MSTRILCSRCGEDVAKSYVSKHRQTGKCKARAVALDAEARGLSNVGRYKLDAMERAGVRMERLVTRWDAPRWGSSGVTCEWWVEAWAYELWHAVDVPLAACNEFQADVATMLQRCIGEPEMRAPALSALLLVPGWGTVCGLLHAWGEPVSAGITGVVA